MAPFKSSLAKSAGKLFGVFRERDLSLRGATQSSRFGGPFNATGGGALLMNVANGEVLSLVSLPNFNINKRQIIKDENYINKITKGVYELGSIFKTFTIALALEKNLVLSETIIKNIPRKIRCSVHEISDIKEFPKDMSVEEILIRSSNIGTLMLARKIGEM